MTERQANVFILTIDSLRADAYNELMSDVTAAVDGVNFTNAFATASNTGSSMPTLAAGVYCDRIANGTPNLDLGPPNGDFTTFAEVLSNGGFDCKLWSDNVIFGTERDYDRGFGGGRTGVPTWKKRAQKRIQRLGSDRIFNTCRWLYFTILSPIVQALPTDGNYNLNASDHHQSTLENLEETTGGQMHWIHYMDVHHPFEPPAEYLEDRPLNTHRSPTKLAELSSKAIIQNRGSGVTDEDIEDIEQTYIAACEYLRDELLSFIEQLTERGHFVPGHDLLVLTSDHGEGFDRDLHGMLGHTPTPSFWDDLVHVPLVISHPKWDPKTVDCQVSQIDLLPTALAALDVPAPNSAVGRAATEPDDLCRDHVYFTATGPYRSYHGVRSQSGWKLFSDRISNSDSVELTGSDDNMDHERVLLTLVEDGNETIRFERDLDADELPSNRRDREQWLDLQRQLSEERGPVATRRFDATLTDETVEQLKQLGYVDNIR